MSDDKPFRLLSDEEFARLMPEEQLLYLSRAFEELNRLKARVKSRIDNADGSLHEKARSRVGTLPG